MRITGYAQGRGQGPGDRQRRGAAFRNRHRVGDRVQGRVLGWEGPGLAWVSIDNQPLLARIGSRPAPGSVMHFRVTALYPEIVLQELGAGPGRGSALLAVMQDFGLARARFEAAAREILGQNAALPEAEGRRKALSRALAQEPDTAGLYLEVARCAALVDSALAGAGQGRFSYPPWLMPGAGRQELVARRAADRGPDKGPPLVELILGFELDGLGAGQIRLLSRGGEAGFRVLLERPDQASALLKFLGAQGPGLTRRSTCLGVDRLPESAHGGVLPEILLGLSGDLTGVSSPV
ncbi:MAG: hypothetical protein PHV85_00985 [Desulfovibrionaceae bacterium]|nr:hypothetical protein [Desulfovibrionaceae bacterium]